MVVEYNNTYLHLFLCEVDKVGGSGLESQAQLPYLGEDATTGAGAGSEHRNQLTAAIRRFIALMMVDGKNRRDGKPAYESIKAVVLGGNASTDGMVVIREILREVFEPSLYGSIPPMYAAAMGAMKRAQEQMKDPKTSDDYTDYPRGEIPEEPKPK